MKQTLRLRGLSDDVKGKVWESDSILRAGRLGSLEIVLDDNSVSRRHAEVRYKPPDGWVVRDLDSTNGTYLNGVRLGPGEKPVRVRDVVQFGKVAMIVEVCDTAHANDPSNQIADHIHVEATTNSSWDEVEQKLLYDREHNIRPGEKLIALLRAGHHLVHVESEDELLTSILNDAVKVLDAQRGAIVLAEGTDDSCKLRLKSLATGRGDQPQGRHYFSQKLAQRCFSRSESILCCSVNDDPELAAAQSIADGAMASVLCVLLRTPRRRIGVLHLDRSYWQKPFTVDDLHLADALAASVSAGIECAQLLKNQRDLFLNTIKVLAQAVELKDEYTGGHTNRVTNFALMLGRQLELPKPQLNLIEIGAPLHDIGKIGVDDAILRKPGKLTPEEFELMKQHTTKGAEIVSTVPDLTPIIPIVRSHHERWDGEGYPDRLADLEIDQLARIVAVVDAFDAMTSNRPYHAEKKGRPPEAAFEELKQQAAKQFDPQCVEAFLAIREEVIDGMRNDRNTGAFETGVVDEI